MPLREWVPLSRLQGLRANDAHLLISAEISRSPFRPSAPRSGKALDYEESGNEASGWNTSVLLKPGAQRPLYRPVTRR